MSGPNAAAQWYAADAQQYAADARQNGWKP